VIFRSNLKQLDEITTGLRHRLLVGREANDSESAVPLSTSSAFITAPNSTTEFQSTLHSIEHPAPDTLASTGDSVTAGDAVTKLMQRTLKNNVNTDVQCVSATALDEHNRAALRDNVGDVRNSPTDGATNPSSELLFCVSRTEAQISEIQASTVVDCRSDSSLKHAQMLLEQLNEMAAFGSQPGAVATCEVNSLPAVDFDEDGMLDDDTLAHIWALRQSSRLDEDDNESLNSVTLPHELDKSYISPRALNDVGSNAHTSSASHHSAKESDACGDTGNRPELDIDRKKEVPVSHSGESGDTWFIDTQDVRRTDDLLAMEVHRRLRQDDSDSEQLDAAGGVRPVQDTSVSMHSPGIPVSQSSPSKMAQLLPAGSSTSSAARKSRLRRTAAQRRERVRREDHVSHSSDSESDDFVSGVKQRRRPPPGFQRDQPAINRDHVDDTRAPTSGASSVVVDDRVQDTVGSGPENPLTANQVDEGNDVDEPYNSNGDVAKPTSPTLNGDAYSEQVLSGHQLSSDEDMYPSDC